MDNSQERLAAKVRAVNQANQKATELQKRLQTIFAPFVGTKIETATGELLAKVKKLIPEFPHHTMLNVYRHKSAYSLVWNVSACEPIKNTCSCLYHEVSAYVGTMDGQTLTGLSEPLEVRTDYTAEEIHNKRAAYETAKKHADTLQSALFPFGETDR